ncbi:unnamed protein product [Lepeophtheirus salmonis]|uniref:(salmon louse) hypothetical protein n=1 Tax=Lepeophtheirus salmonis TaxID=72036 RepID=A0A7R8H0I5_LEPSM|nr:unnamed protein product [Lepeophtheirus salmonis]CAF2771130.1 unnamed protein product [Lepeophtheirus salmonis]
MYGKACKRWLAFFRREDAHKKTDSSPKEVFKMNEDSSCSYFLFNSSHDVLFSHLRPSFAQALYPDDIQKAHDHNFIMHIFSPLLTSHKILKSHLGFGYESLSSFNDFQLVISELLNYVFIIVGRRKSSLKRNTSLCLDYLKKLCGPNPEILKTSLEYAHLFKNVLDGMEIMENNLMRIFDSLIRLPCLSLYEQIHQTMAKHYRDTAGTIPI